MQSRISKMLSQLHLTISKTHAKFWNERHCSFSEKVEHPLTRRETLHRYWFKECLSSWNHNNFKYWQKSPNECFDFLFFNRTIEMAVHQILWHLIWNHIITCRQNSGTYFNLIIDMLYSGVLRIACNDYFSNHETFFAII